MDGWNASSWRSKQIAQQPEYPSLAELQRIEGELSRRPPPVFANEIEDLVICG
jgi:3-deoxy-7-phosphoheptulonate synthase